MGKHTYGIDRRRVQLAALALAAALCLAGAGAQARKLHVVAFGDSLTAGLGLPEGDAFPAVLQRALAARGRDVEIVNAGVSGETAEDGLARYDWTVPPETDAVILELGANDMLRGMAPEGAKAALAEILARLKKAGIPTLLAGMRAAPNLGADYQRRFDAIYPDLADRYGAALYPFFLEGVAGDPALNQKDGLHPTRAGVDRIVAAMLPAVEEVLAHARP